MTDGKHIFYGKNVISIKNSYITYVMVGQHAFVISSILRGGNMH